MKKIHDVESQLGTKWTKIVEFANQFMIQIAVFEHPMNDFESMDEKIYKGLVKPSVIDTVKDYVQIMFAEMEETFVEIQLIIAGMKENKADANYVNQKTLEAALLIEKVDQKAIEIENQQLKIKKSWIDALCLQEE